MFRSCGFPRQQADNIGAKAEPQATAEPEEVSRPAVGGSCHGDFGPWCVGTNSVSTLRGSYGKSGKC